MTQMLTLVAMAGVIFHWKRSLYSKLAKQSPGYALLNCLVFKVRIIRGYIKRLWKKKLDFFIYVNNCIDSISLLLVYKIDKIFKLFNL